MEFGKMLIVENVKQKQTRPIFDEFLSMDDKYERIYDTLVFQNAFKILHKDVCLDVSLYINPILYNDEYCAHVNSITMTELKKHMGWIYRDGKTTFKLVQETIDVFLEYASQNGIFSEMNIVCPLKSNVAIEARGSSDWQGADSYATAYKVIAVGLTIETANMEMTN